MKVTVQFLAVAFSFFSGLSLAVLNDIKATDPANLQHFTPIQEVGYQLRETFTDLTLPDHVDRFAALVKLVGDKIDNIGSLTVTDLDELHELGLALLFIKKHINSGRDFSSLSVTFEAETEVLYQAGLRAMENFYDYHKQQNHIAALPPHQRIRHNCLLLTRTATCLKVTIDDIIDYDLIEPSDEDLKDFKDNVMGTLVNGLAVSVTQPALRNLIVAARTQIAIFDDTWKTYKAYILKIWDDALFNDVVRYTLQPGYNMVALYQQAANQINRDEEYFEKLNFLSLIADVIPDDTEKQAVKLELKHLALPARHYLKTVLLQNIPVANTQALKDECMYFLLLLYTGNVHVDILSNLDGVFDIALDISAAENLQFRNFIDDYYQNDATEIQRFDDEVYDCQIPELFINNVARAPPVKPPLKDRNGNPIFVQTSKVVPVNNGTTVGRFVPNYSDMASAVNETAKAPEEATEGSKKDVEEATKTKIAEDEKAEVGGKPMGNGMKIAIGAGVVVAVVAVAAAGYYFLAV